MSAQTEERIEEQQAGGRIAEKLLFPHTDPGTVAGRYMRMFWQPIYVSRELPVARPRPVKVMGEELTLYRGESGEVFLVGHRCAHRGAQMSAGWVEGDCLRCFYHGWMYDGTGQCVEQPVENSRSADRVRIPSHPVHESMGLVFAYLGEGEPPDFPRFPGLDDWDGVTLAGSVHWRFNYYQSLENSMDITHTSFVHRGSHDYSAEIFSMNPVESEAGITQVARRSNDSVTFIGQLGMPNSFFMNFPLPPNDDLSTLMWWVPLDDHNHHVFNVRRIPKAAEPFLERIKTWGQTAVDPQDLADRVLAGDLDREDIDLSTTNDVFFQDFVAQRGQGLIADRENERLGQGDKGVIKLRQLWTAELRKVAAGEPIQRWLSPTAGPIMYYKPQTEEELDALLAQSPLQRELAPHG